MENKRGGGRMTTRKNWQCPECKSIGFAVFKTYPHQNYILRWVKCKKCKYNMFTKEEIITKEDVTWRSENNNSYMELKK